MPSRSALAKPVANDHSSAPPSVRLASNSDGATIHRLVTDSGFAVEDIDWSVVYPYWLVAEQNGDVVGCIQVCIGVPIGRLEMLSVRADLSHMLRAAIVKSLLLAGAATLKKAGAQMVSGMIPFEMKSYKRLLQRRGCVSIGVGNMMARRL